MPVRTKKATQISIKKSQTADYLNLQRNTTWLPSSDTGGTQYAIGCKYKLAPRKVQDLRSYNAPNPLKMNQKQTLKEHHRASSTTHKINLRQTIFRSQPNDFSFC